MNVFGPLIFQGSGFKGGMAADNLVAGGLGHWASADFSGSEPRATFGGGAGSKHAR